MGSLLAVMAVTVTADRAAGLDGAAVNVSVEVPPIRGVAGENDAVTPLGSPLTLRSTRRWRRERLAWNETVMLVVSPAWIAAEAGLSCIV